MADAEPDRPVGRADLAAMIAPLQRDLLQAEVDVLAGHGLSMWAYVVLLSLDERPIRTQAALADAIGADRTRIIDVLDDLQHRELISRRPDPADRRARLLSLTATGRQLRDTAQAAIQAREERMLATLTPAARATFLDALRVLSAAPARSLLRAE
jgi:MarR family transcriptional regulator, organic hydroperoxide resistance regulator